MQSEHEIIADGLGFPEGPVVMADGSVIVVEIFAGRVSRCWNGRRETICEPGGGPNGAAIGPDGALYVCNNGGMGPKQPEDGKTGRIERIDLATGRHERLYDACGDRALSAPNDLVFDCDGNLWFTDFGKREPNGKQFGGLYCCRPDGSAITRIVDAALSYNGVGISPDMKTVYVSDTFQARLYTVDRKLAVQTATLLATVPGDVHLDSLAMTEAGNICIATIGSAPAISTVTPSGQVTSTPTKDRYTTNIAFGGADMRDAYITYAQAGMLMKMRWPEPGMRLIYNG